MATHDVPPNSNECDFLPRVSQRWSTGEVEIFFGDEINKSDAKKMIKSGARRLAGKEIDVGKDSSNYRNNKKFVSREDRP